jgi:Zn-dependent M28 family amino/carboxypeptidase
MKANSEVLRNHLLTISKKRNPFENLDSLLEIETYIENQFLSFGYDIQKESFPFYGQHFNNVIASKNSSGVQPRFIIGAHFDAVPETEGADDNASGVAVLLEAARILAESEKAPPIDFVAFNVEEYGMVGSSQHVAALKEKKTKILGMISLEMVGFTSSEPGSQKLPWVLRPFYPDVGNFLALVGDAQSKDLLEKAKKAFAGIERLPVETLTVPLKGWVFPECRLSDHAPFWDAGFPALLVTDTSFFRNPHYHRSTDRVDTLDLTFMSSVTEGVVRLTDSLF